MTLKKLIATVILTFSLFTVLAGQHPGLFLTSTGVKEIRTSLGKYQTFDKSYNELKQLADNALTKEIEVPVPKDGGGGYTHEKHKNNYYEMNAAGIMYQLSGNKKYAQFVNSMLLKYAALYPSLGTHPAANSETPGRLFWQTLNDAVWLVHTANAYDCVYDFMSKNDRQFVEKNLFYPMAEFISNGNPENYAVFNKMHNHGTWATSAVGMIGYVMGDKELVSKALYGSNKDGKTGFIRQLDVLFSPDGYFTEGPYYQRYSIWPFMTFAQVIQNQQPELKIFSYRDNILQKAVNTLLQCAYNGEIFFMNDALLKTYQTQEIVYAVDIAYKNNPANKQLLDIARQQRAFIVSDAGLATAKALYQKEQKTFQYKSILLHDGAKGNEGGIAILRTGEANKQTCLTFKATSHGLSHGHYDKLSIALYDNGNDILSDYGAARFLNIEPKSGGGYTKENHSFAAQTIAHNTVTVDEKSDFNGDIKVSSKNHSDIQYCSLSNPNVQIISGIEKNAYKGVELQRTTALVSDNKLIKLPFVIDVFRVNSDSAHVVDFPFYYKGQMVSTNFKYQKNITELKPLGLKNGYQHLWLEATGTTDKPNACFTWVNGNRFYSITSLTTSGTELFHTRIGAGDPNFNLRNDPCFMLRQPNVKNHTFVSLIEPHGQYDLSKEITSGFETSIKNIEVLADNVDYTAIKILTKNGDSSLFITMNKDFDNAKSRKAIIAGKEILFNGNYYYSDYNNIK
ncbi:MAG: alginate lyase family protein [Paludibacter sp.]